MKKKINILIIGQRKVTKLINEYQENKDKDRQLFLSLQEKYLAIDNTTGDCFVEEFDTIEEAIEYLTEYSN